MKKYVFLTIMVFVVSGLKVAAQDKYSVSSPDKRVEVTVTVARRSGAKSNRFKFGIVSDGRVLLKDKRVNMLIKSVGHYYKFHKSTIYDIQRDKTPTYNSIQLLTDIGVTMEIRAYNDSVCYRYFVRGHTEEYQVTNVSPIFPHDRPQAIIGTYIHDLVLPWHTLDIDHDKEKTMNLPKANTQSASSNSFMWGMPQKSPNLDATRPIERSRRVLNWDDAPITITAGYTVTDYFGKQWHKTAEQSGVMADITYKYLYGGLSFMPCNQLTFINYGHAYPPFEKTMGSIHSWSLGAKMGVSLPIQFGYNILNITPYCGYSFLSLLQHTERVGTIPVDKHHSSLGPGLKLQITFPERLSVGLSYEQLFFVTDEACNSMRSYIFSIGYQF